jgi:hypothetical protein
MSETKHSDKPKRISLSSNFQVLSELSFPDPKGPHINAQGQLQMVPVVENTVKRLIAHFQNEK